ncbi:hypothetical protein [Brevundimonas denitrificans]|uniref:hypothetical protein n=1 Tax=Brevundimonas denitrificans TaxID=1443434 RepID=UPI00223B6266|nr:hypothetical protein [Brevundimonas denitrificans]
MTGAPDEPPRPDPAPEVGPDEKGAATSEPPRKDPAETLTLRAAPRRIVRFRRGVVIGGAAAGSLAIAGVAWMALAPQTLRMAAEPDEPSVSDRRAPPDAIANLPPDYSRVTPTTPRLGSRFPATSAGRSCAASRSWASTGRPEGVRPRGRRRNRRPSSSASGSRRRPPRRAKPE